MFSMSISLQNKHPLVFLNHLPTYGRTSPVIRSSGITTIRREPRSSQQAIQPSQPVNLATPTSTTSTSSSRSPLLNDADDLQSTWSHRAWVATGCTTVFISLTKSVAGAIDSQILIEPLLAGYMGYILADLGSGVYHWGIDNYGDGSTPLFGGQIEAFQGHHKWPWTITKRQFANNLHSLAKYITFAVLPLDLFFDGSVFHAFVSVCSFCLMFSQQFHAWAHGTKSKLPPLVVAAQDVGMLVSRLQHGAHHRAPYNNNYCIVSGVWNEFLDDNKVFEALEMVLFFKLGLRPRSWSEPNSAWQEESSEAI